MQLDQEQWLRLKPLLTTALRLSPDERIRFFEEHLGSDAQLRSRALEMLRLYDDASRFITIGTGDVLASTDASFQPDFDSGAEIGHYRIIRRLGEGGMGRIYLAEDERLGRRVALKRLHSSSGHVLGSSYARAIAESRSIAILNHPGIVVLYDVFEYGGELILAMEHVEGRPLSALIAAGPIPVGFALRLIEQVADAVAYAHAHGVLHCDLKPSNIHVLSSGATKILDFGLARIVTASNAEEDTPPPVFGTAGYLSPEQLCFRSPTGASDIYAIGVVFFELLTGRLPFETDNQGQLLFDTVATPPPVPSSVMHGIPPAIDDVISKCLSKSPRERLQAHEVVRAIRNVPPLSEAERPPIDRDRTGPTEERPAGVRTFRRQIVAALAIAGVLSVGLWIGWHRHDSWLSRWTASQEEFRPVSLAILPTVGRLQRTEDTALGKAIPALLRPALSRINGVNVVLLDDERSSVDVPPQTALRNLGTTLAVRCLLTSGDSASNVQVELFSSEGAARLFNASVPFDSQSPARTFEQVFLAVERGLGPWLRRARATSGASPASGLVPSALALNHFTEGVEMLERPDVAGNVERAITLLESATAKDPSSAIAQAALARAQWMHYVDTRSEESARKAQTAVMTALSLDNTLVPVKLSAAIIQRGMGELDRAERTLAEVIAAAPTSDEAHRLLGELLAARGQQSRAQTEFDAAIALRPLYWRNHRAKGLAYYEAGDFEKAAASFARVTQLQPDSAWGYQMLGAALHQRGDYKNAVVAYETALRLGPTAAAWSNIGKLHYDNGQYDKAVEAYKEALKIRNASAVTWRNLGDVLTVMGRSTEATAAYQQAEEFATRTTRVNPSDASALSILAVIHAKLGRKQEAISEAARASALSPNDRTVQYRRAVVLALTGDRAAGQAAIDQAIRLGFSVTEAKLDRDLRGLRFEAR